jgi:regulator of nucleoside diphosphate kinase
MATVRKPQITLSSLDVDRIEALLAAIPASVFPGKAELQAELDRADMVAPDAIPPTVVTMNSTVQFSILETGKEFCLTLVYPRDMDGSADKISIFAPVGGALLGLSVGDELAWPGPGGKSMTVRVKAVLYQPESSGELHR